MLKKLDEKCCNTMKVIMAVIGVIVVVAAIAFAVYKFITRCKSEEDCCDCADLFEEEESCIELEFACPKEDEEAPEEPVQAEEEPTIAE